MLSVESRRRDFPSLEGQAYLNTAAENIPPQRVFDAVNAYMRDKCDGMNGRKAHFERVHACRSVAARMIGLAPEEVSFCSCSSEAYNLLANAIDPQQEDEIVISDLDFPAGATPWMLWRTKPRIQLWRSIQGVLRQEDLPRLLNSKTKLVQLSLVSFWNGYRIDWPAVLECVRRLAPQAVIAVDVTQALGRIETLCPGADVIISSTHKWSLGIHGGCVVGVIAEKSHYLSARAGGWYHIDNAFDPDRFERISMKQGAASYSVGMPNFSAIYALEAGLSYLDGVGMNLLSAHADRLVTRFHDALCSLGITPMCPIVPNRMSGIVAFQHEKSLAMYEHLEAEKIRVMHQAGRIRIAIHGYNTIDDIDQCIDSLRRFLEGVRNR